MGGNILIKISLQRTLDEIDITVHKLSVDYKLRSSTIYKLLSGETTQIKFETLNIILNVLNNIAIEKGINKTYTITDIIDYEYKRGE
ncbi:XRE family transcriptional regulator [Butyricicoccus sp. 1XD8-22]|nr:XRE family transcriptional regulator [Butyricicoccus sp. 1XD8-22]